MSSSNVQSTLSELEWDDGFAIPVANEPNKKLEIEVRSKTEIVRTTRLDSEIHKKRSDALKDHLTHVQQDLKSTVQFLAAKKRERESEDHQKMIADRESGRLKQEIQRLKQQLDDNHGTTIKFENQIYTSNTKIQELKQNIAWDQKKLEEWLSESSKQDDNVLIIHKYMKEDDSKLKQLMLTMERLTGEVKTARKVLNSEHTETLTGQIEVDKTAEDFRRQQSDREELILQWRSTLDQLKTRDLDINRVNHTIAEQMQVLQNEKQNLNQQQNFFEQEQQNNNELEKKIDDRTRTSSKLIDQFQAAKKEMENYQSELQTAKFGVERVTSDLEQLKVGNQGKREDHAIKLLKLEESNRSH
jgi:UDP-glucose:O-linked fucose beta-1,3-glucosyltransferase